MSLAVRFLSLLIRGYQLVLRPILPPACKFVPSCSEYAIEALRTHGVLRGGALGAWRILRCNPFTAGGYDPVPERHIGKPDAAACAATGCCHPKNPLGTR